MPFLTGLTWGPDIHPFFYPNEIIPYTYGSFSRRHFSRVAGNFADFSQIVSPPDLREHQTFVAAIILVCGRVPDRRYDTSRAHVLDMHRFVCHMFFTT